MHWQCTGKCGDGLDVQACRCGEASNWKLYLSVPKTQEYKQAWLAEM